ncbi:HWE histidine kinase domain-containing protein [Glacieibacterium sp.]|uniref:HWE histidine kinase domain-containing protein n=1 Tax=Glacieibacterium sp. TaxID=2860237 RepID=UPI003B0075BE
MTEIEPDLQGSYTVDMTSCDREPIHHISAIQPIGFLIALSSEWRVARVSANIVDFLGLPIKALLGASLRDVFHAEAIHLIRNRLSLLNGADAVERSFAVQLQDGGPSYDLAIHQTGGLIIIEAEPNVPTGDLNAGAMLRSMLARTKGQASLVREAARLMQALTGFDRVMIYRFHPDGSGEVIAERVRTGLEPFLGLRYPAEDIPQQARALLLRNPVRVLVDVGAVPSPLVPASDGFNQPLDLSMSTLRAHSTMHIEYLQNMGVAATMTVSLVRDGLLWGLISCHHMAPRHIGFEQRTTAELFGELLSLLIEKRERAEVAAYEEHASQLRQQLVATAIERGSAAQTMTQLADRIADLVPCDGIAVYVDGDVTLRGETPTAAECGALRGFLDEHVASRIYATAEIGRVWPEGRAFVDRAAGMLVLPISRSAQDYLVFFRHEMAHAVTWAGRPNKLLVVGSDGPRLTPRKSFAAWREVVRGQSAIWTPAELIAAENMRVTLIEIILRRAGETETENRATTQKQELLIAELNHRVRNILGLIRGLVAQSRMSAQDVDTFATVLGDRVHALARAHDQITAENWGPGSLATLIDTEAAAFLGDGATRVSSDGPAVLLQPQAFSTIALVIHELMTNAAKHGALSEASGDVAIRWTLGLDGSLALDWTETGGPEVQTPSRRGFGSTIIHRSVPHELGGEASLDYAPGGLHARFVIPARHVVRGEDLPIAAVLAIATTPAGRLSGTVLLVEDNIIIALGAEDVLTALGANEVLMASDVAGALRLIAAQTPSFAILDINLGIEMSWPIASRLRELGIRYVFATGYGEGIDFPLEHRQAPVIAKPYSQDSIARSLGIA